jgi:phage tail sheath protein FI
VNPSNATPDADLDLYTTPLPLGGGTQSTVQDTDYTAALTALDTIDGNLILNAVGQTSSTVISGFVAKAANRGDSFVIIDPDSDDTTLNEIQATAANFSSLSNGGYAAHYAPMLEMIDPAKTGPGAIRTTYPGGAIAGLFVRTEVERTVAKAPGGYQAEIRGALGTALKLSDQQIGALYNGTPQVNSFKAVPGAGVIVFGVRTLQKVNPDKYINVRRTLNYLKHNLKQLTDFAVFEANDSRLWSEINIKVSSFLSEFWRAGGLKGDQASSAFYVVCDETNNTATTIDQGIVNVSVGVALQYPAEFISINLAQWSGGSNAVESL